MFAWHSFANLHTIAINKPTGLSSAQVIRDCQAQFNPSATFAPMLQMEKDKRMAEGSKAFNRRSRNKKELRVKMGHGGTLDPLASGVLILGLGAGTKSLQSFLDCTKTYETVVVFGASTDSYDRVGRILTRKGYDHVTKEMVVDALGAFRGLIKQTPPLYSALKMEGKPLYEYAREGKPIPREIPMREVQVENLELLEWYPPGSHKHYWPTEEADAAECQLAEKVWKAQETNKSLTPDEKRVEEEALAAHEAAKRKFEDDVDGLVRDRPAHKKQKKMQNGQNRKGGDVMMSGALGTMPKQEHSNKGTNLVPTADPDAEAPWEGEGPPAAKIRMTVTSGFYVRSFCHDLGAKVGSAAMMAELCRSRQGDFELGGENCLDYEDIIKGEEVWSPRVTRMLENWSTGKVATAQGAGTSAAETASVKDNRNGAKEQTKEETAIPSAEPEATNGEVPIAAEAQRDDDEESWKGFQD